MSIERIIELLKVEKECVERNERCSCGRHCEKCDLVQETNELIAMYGQLIDLLEKEIGVIQ